jgi:hypothetical protein
LVCLNFINYKEKTYRKVGIKLLELKVVKEVFKKRYSSLKKKRRKELFFITLTSVGGMCLGNRREKVGRRFQEENDDVLDHDR